MLAERCAQLGLSQIYRGRRPAPVFTPAASALNT